jgi:signal transduction histidine kinase
MRIRTQFIITMALFGIMLLFTVGGVFVTIEQVERLHKHESAADEIERAVRELGYLSNDYLLYRESPQRGRWEAKFSSLSVHLSSLESDSTEQRALVDQIKMNQERLKAVFSDVVSILEGTPRSLGVTNEMASLRVAWSRMEVQNQGMIFDAIRLSHLFREQEEQLKQRNTLLVFGMIGIFVAYFILNYLLTYRRTLKSISGLQVGTRIVGSGNLNYTIKEIRNDEIGDLAHAFNEMTAKLSSSYSALELEVAERKRAQEELKRYMAKLEQNNQALQEFASIASHDMREPLRKVTNFGNLLEQKHGLSLGEEGKNYLTRMLNAADRMQLLLNSLFDYARVSTKAEPFREVDLTALIHEVLSDLEVSIEKTGGTVELGELPAIKADPSQIRQLFQNLIGNALKFHKEGEKPVVEVRSSVNGSHRVQITVEDNGIGFDEKHLDQIFAPFHRLHGRSSGYEGAGMGLAICRKIVERHGGSITAKSAPGAGAKFIVTLPATPP